MFALASCVSDALVEKILALCVLEALVTRVIHYLHVEAEQHPGEMFPGVVARSEARHLPRLQHLHQCVPRCSHEDRLGCGALRDLELLLQNDQVLVAKMLAMVNSPFYGLNRAVNTVKEAVMVLGFRGVRSLVLATSTAKLLQRDFGCYGHEPKGLWMHAVCVASGARSLAKRLGLPADDAEQLFVCGLLHDIDTSDLCLA